MGNAAAATVAADGPDPPLQRRWRLEADAMVGRARRAARVCVPVLACRAQPNACRPNAVLGVGITPPLSCERSHLKARGARLRCCTSRRLNVMTSLTLALDSCSGLLYSPTPGCCHHMLGTRTPRCVAGPCSSRVGLTSSPTPPRGTRPADRLSRQRFAPRACLGRTRWRATSSSPSALHDELPGTRNSTGRVEATTRPCEQWPAR